MGEFTFDTSGIVRIVHEGPAGDWSWDQLSPFAQGYVEALFASLQPQPLASAPKVKLTDNQRQMLERCLSHGSSKEHSSAARTAMSLADRGLVTWCWSSPIDWARVTITDAGRAALSPEDYELCGCGSPTHVKEAACLACGRTKASDQPPGFSDLSPEALALILRDCEDFYGAASAGPPDAIKGRMFWRFRNDGHYDRFPPLIPYLSDDGKVCLR